ncbi:MAG TPA: hypothetical protein VHF05_02690 [Candidatus Paceibacterota bacterium]|nr:hypothetical protein [Candidatus Paceibacterota bacterium]
MKTQRMNVVLLPSEEDRQKFGRFADELAAKFNLMMIVNNKEYIPHLTLYQINVKEHHLERAREVTRILSKQSSFFETVEDPGRGDNNSFDYNVHLGRKIFLLHVNALRVFQEVRAHDQAIDIPDADSTDAQRENIKLYGVKNVLKLYRPHVTIGCVTDEDDLELILHFLEKKPVNPVHFTELALAKINAFGQVYEIVENCPLAD